MPRNNKDFSEGNGSSNPTQDKLEGMFKAVGADMVKDPFTGTVHVDLSDPNHPFWGPGGWYGDGGKKKD